MDFTLNLNVGLARKALKNLVVPLIVRLKEVLVLLSLLLRSAA